MQLYCSTIFDIQFQNYAISDINVAYVLLTRNYLNDKVYQKREKTTENFAAAYRLCEYSCNKYYKAVLISAYTCCENNKQFRKSEYYSHIFYTRNRGGNIFL